MTLSSYYANKEESQRHTNRKLQKLEESNIRVTDLVHMPNNRPIIILRSCKIQKRPQCANIDKRFSQKANKGKLHK